MFLALAIVAILLGLVGVLVHGMVYLLITGIGLFVADLAYLAPRWRHSPAPRPLTVTPTRSSPTPGEPGSPATLPIDERHHVTESIWTYRATSGYPVGADLTGFKVEASDGAVGKVSKHSDAVGSRAGRNVLRRDSAHLSVPARRPAPGIPPGADRRPHRFRLPRLDRPR